MRRVLAPLGLTWIVLAVAGIAAARAEAFMMIEVPPPNPRFDARVPGPVVSQRQGPPPISGGTLLALRDGHRVVASDPDRDRVLVIDLDRDPAIVARVEGLPRGAEPGRAVEDDAGRVHVVLRGAGAIASFDPAAVREGHPTDEVTAVRRVVCPMPRGIAASGGSLHVACRGGELVTLPAAGGAPTRTVRLDRDLRDVIVAGELLHVTRFRSAEILVIDGAGSIVERHRPPTANHDGQVFEPEVAWRAIALAGTTAMLHQRATRNEVTPSIGGYGPMRSSGCDGIVRSAITTFGDGLVTEGPEIATATLPVDLAIVPGDAIGTYERMAIVAAGNESGESSVIVASAPALRGPGCLGSAPFGGDAITNPIAVAYASDRRLVVQQRDPARLVVIGDGGAGQRAIDLGGESAFDTGHAIFHAATDAGIACASCHPEGGEDGHVWRFSGLGDRRTPALHAVRGTAPFHWGGDLADVRALMNEVFVLRMRGASLGADHADAVESWLGHVPAPRASAGDRAAIARGRALFEGEAGCAECHSGPLLSSGRSADVGTGGSFQVPSLIGAADRLPLMHDGCATTLRARFDPSCGGERHGPALADSQLVDMLAYLESL